LLARAIPAWFNEGVHAVIHFLTMIRVSAAKMHQVMEVQTHGSPSLTTSHTITQQNTHISPICDCILPM